MHVYIAAGHARKTIAFPGFLQQGKALPVARAREKFDGDPAAIRELHGEPGGIFVQRLCRRQPERETMWDAGFEVITREAIFAFRSIAPASRDQFGQVAVAFPVLRKQHEAQTVIETELGADD